MPRLYKSGGDCINGHINPWRKSIGRSCIECIKIRKKNSESEKRYREKNKLKIRLRVYNITEEFFNEMVKNQNNKCKICNVELGEGKNRHIDHCAETKLVRGLLCGSCNTGIGQLKHNPEIMRKAALYCEHFKAIIPDDYIKVGCPSHVSINGE